MSEANYANDKLFDALSRGRPKITLDTIREIVDVISYDVLCKRRNAGFARKYQKDFSQMIFEKLLRLSRADKISYFGNFRGYVYRVAGNLFHNAIKKYNRHTQHSNLCDPSEMTDLVRIDLQIEHLLDQRSLLTEVRTFLEQSECVDRTIASALLRQVEEGLKVKEIARELNLKPNTLTVQLIRLRKKLWLRFGTRYLND